MTPREDIKYPALIDIKTPAAVRCFTEGSLDRTVAQNPLNQPRFPLGGAI